MALRNIHTKEDLEADKFPTAKIQVPRSALKFPAAGAEASGDAKGKLTIHGQHRDVTFSYTAKRDGDVYKVKSSTPRSRRRGAASGRRRARRGPTRGPSALAPARAGARASGGRCRSALAIVSWRFRST